MKCRVCGNRELYPALRLGSQKLTGVFPKDVEANEQLHSGDVTLMKCDDSTDSSACGLLQIKASFDPDMMYGDTYGYRSGLNASMVTHLHGKIDRVMELVNLKEGDLVVDVGSNDGTSLNHYPQWLNRVGVDPTGGKYREFYSSDVELIEDFFNADVLNKSGFSEAKIITSFSMFYDLEDPVAFALDIAKSLHSEGVWVFEQSYLPLMLERNSFDTACHEHVEYYSLKSINAILTRAGLKMVSHEFNDINGGSVSIVAALEESNFVDDPALPHQLRTEFVDLGLADPRTYKSFCDRIDNIGTDLKALIERLKKSGATVAGLGASTKGNVLLQYYGLSTDYISVIGEVNPDKFGSITPGTKIPIVAEDEALESDYLVVLPWHFREFFVSNKKFSGKGLIFPLPRPEIVYVP